jgi:hypothetical protein
MTIQDALHTAIAGGYRVEGSDGVATSFSGANSEYSAWTRTDNHSTLMIPMHETFLDPAFWRALGRALGWEAPCTLAITCRAGQEESWRGRGAYWMYQWHCFIQHLAQGGSPETFFVRLPRRTPPCTAPRPPQGRMARSGRWPPGVAGRYGGLKG